MNGPLYGTCCSPTYLRSYFFFFASASPIGLTIMNRNHIVCLPASAVDERSLAGPGCLIKPLWEARVNACGAWSSIRRPDFRTRTRSCPCLLYTSDAADE